MTIDSAILVLDDVNVVGELVDAAASGLGLHWESVTDPSVLAKKLTPETKMILLDPMMAKVSGPRVIEFMGEQHCKANIVLMSGDGGREVKIVEKMAIVHGISIIGHLHKPFRPTELEKLLRLHFVRQDVIANKHDSEFEFDQREVRYAVERDEFVLHYQPQIEVATRKVVGFEAVVRWMHPEQGLIFPNSFLPQIRALGLFDEFNRLIADRALSEMNLFVDQDHRMLRLSLRASIESMRDVDLANAFASMAKKHGVPLAIVILEIAGAEIMDEKPLTLDVLNRLTMKNIRLSVHDSLLSKTAFSVN